VGVRRFRKNNVIIRYVATLILIPALLVSASYALFSQQLSVGATTASVSYTSSQYTTMTYTKTTTPSGPNFIYSFSPTVIKNNGVTSITAWQVKFTLPADVTTVTCPSTVTCSRSGTTETIVNGAGNGTIATGATTSFNFSFTSATALYTLQNVIVSATFSTAFQTVAGLTTSIVAGTSSKKGKTWTWNPTITVINNSGQSLSGWRLVVTPWSTSYAVTSTMPSGVTFATSATQLTFTSTNVLATGTQYQFTPTIKTNTASWSPSGVVTGKA